MSTDQNTDTSIPDTGKKPHSKVEVVDFECDHESLKEFKISYDDFVNGDGRTWSDFEGWEKADVSAVGKKFTSIVASCFVFGKDKNGETQVLLVQRDPKYAMAFRWEVPGGRVELDDGSILHGAARELLEETGLVVTRIRRVLPREIFITPTRNNHAIHFKFVSEVKKDETGMINPDLSHEHVDCRWASREEILAMHVFDKPVIAKIDDNCLTTEGLRKGLLQGFDLWEEIQAEDQAKRDAENPSHNG